MSADPAASAVTAALGWPLRGTDMLETLTVLRGELGAPHLSELPVLPDRGPHAEAEARTCAMLDSLYADRQPHGWRITSTPGQDSRAARHLLNSDLNVLADVLGAESGGDRGPVLISLVGPVSLAARVHLHNGEKFQADPGARRELTQSWCAGVTDLIGALRRNTDGRDVVVSLDETDLLRVLDGTIPTASGYRTLRSLPRQEVRGALTQAVSACHDAGAEQVALATGGAPSRWARDVGADAAVVVPPTGPVQEWEPLAALAESGLCLWFPVVTPSARSVRPAVDRIWRPWRELGMAPSTLLGSRVLPTASINGITPPELPGFLRRVTDTAGALTELGNGG